MLKRLGVELTFICCSPEREGEYGSPEREAEFEAACKHYNARPVMLDGWDDFVDLKEQLQKQRIEEWDMVLTHSHIGELNLHPEHVEVHKAVKQYLKDKKWDGVFATFGIGVQSNVSFLPTEDDWRTKRRAILSHNSQAEFLRRMDFADRPVESFMVERL